MNTQPLFQNNKEQWERNKGNNETIINHFLQATSLFLLLSFFCLSLFLLSFLSLFSVGLSIVSSRLSLSLPRSCRLFLGSLFSFSFLCSSNHLNYKENLRTQKLQISFLRNLIRDTYMEYTQQTLTGNS